MPPVCGRGQQHRRRMPNYVMLEVWPAHARVRLYSGLSDGKIVVRRARNGESIQTLDGQDHDLTDKMLAICDNDKPVAVAGVMGGANSEIEDDTKTVVFESACFHRRDRPRDRQGARHAHRGVRPL